MGLSSDIVCFCLQVDDTSWRDQSMFYAPKNSVLLNYSTLRK